MSSDDLDFSSSGFSSDGDDVRKDAELERRNLHKDLAIGGLEMLDEKEDDEFNVIQQDQEVKTNDQLRLRYGSAREMQEHQKQNINQSAQRIEQMIQQNIRQLNEIPSNADNVQLQQQFSQSKLDRKARQLQNRKNNELQKENKELQRKLNEVQRQMEINRLKQEHDQQLAANEANIQLDQTIVHDKIENDISPVSHDQSENQGLQKQHKLVLQQSPRSDQPFQQQTDFFQNIVVKRDTEQQNVNFQFQVSYETNSYGFSETDLTPYQLAVWEESIYMFLLNAQKFDRNKALLWGKVPVLTEKELDLLKKKQKITQYNNLQNACVIVDGLQYQYYLQLSDEIHNQLFNLPDSLNQFGNETEWNEIFNQFGQPILQDDLLIYEENTSIPEQFIKNKDELQKYLQAIQNFIKQKTNNTNKTIIVKPVLRVYCFNNVDTPRQPRFWIRVRYDSALPKLPEFTKVSQLFEQNTVHNVNEIEAEYNRLGIMQMFGSSIDPLELFLCEKQIKCCSWIRFQGLQVTMYKERWGMIMKDHNAQPQNNVNHYNYERYNKLLSSKTTRLFHELYVPYDKGKFESLGSEERLMSPVFSTLTFTFISAYSEKLQQQLPFLAVLTFMPKVGIQQQGGQKDKDAITYIIGARFDGQMPFQNKNTTVYLNSVSFGQFYQSDQTRVQLVTANSEIDLIDKTHQIIAQHNPDFIIGHGIYDAYSFMFQQVFNKNAKLPEHIIKEMLFKCSRLNQVSQLRAQNNMTGREIENKVQQIFGGRIIIDLERSIQEFSPDTKLTTLEHCFNTLFPDWSFQALPVSSMVEYYKNVNNDFETVLVRGLIQQQFANLRVQRGLNVLQLYSGISRITFSPLQSVIQHGRAKRVETLLLSRFVRLPFILPDYPNSLEENNEKYEGGYVIEPQPGFYDSMIIVLDFNSLYPSVIREYDICFTTVPPDVRESEALQVISQLKQFIFSRQLPQLMDSLVKKRLEVKRKIKTTQVKLKTNKNDVQLNNQLQELDIEQLALKLCANSMYGCLGYRLGRFFCPKVASTITYQGRQALNNAISVAEHNGYKVVYGDTDSIMIDSKLSLIQIDQQKFMTPGPEQNEARNKIKAILNQCESIASDLSKKIGEGKQYLEMGMDYVFARQLLLQKKKYAALKIDPISYDLKLEIRGLDMVRRDWCLLSRQICNKVVTYLLWMGKAQGVEKTLEYLTGFKNDMDQRNQHIKLEFFMLTKSITKALAQYDKSQSLPHVEVARWLQKNQGKAIKPGFVVKYLALSDEGQQILLNATKNEKVEIYNKQSGPFFYPYDLVAAKTKGIHPLQIIDLHWYVKSQLIPPLERLYAPIDDVSSQDVASIFGFEYAAQAVTSTSEHRDVFDTDLRRRYSDCFCFIYRCPKCNTLYSWPDSPILQVGFAPQVSFTKPSRRHRNTWADIQGKSFLDPQDFEKIQCGHEINPQDVIEQLLQQIQHYEWVYRTGMRTCLKNDCVCHLTNDETKRLISRLPDTVEMNYDNLKSNSGFSTGQDASSPQGEKGSSLSEVKVEWPMKVKPAKQGLMTPGNICVEPQCGGELAPVFTRQNLVLQFLFFQEIFDCESQFYRENGRKVHQNKSDLFSFINQVLSQYAKMTEIGTVQVSETLGKIFQSFK